MGLFKDQFLGGYPASSLLPCPATGLHQPLIACRRRRGHIKGEGSPLAGGSPQVTAASRKGFPRGVPGPKKRGFARRR